MPLLNKPIGVIRGQGVGPEVMEVALRCLARIGSCYDLQFRLLEYGGLAPATEYSEVGYKELKKFYSKIERLNGCIIRSAIYAKIVYTLRSDFDLAVKPIYFSPIPELFDSSLLKVEQAQKINLLLIRENAQGFLFSKERSFGPLGKRRVEGTFIFKEEKIRPLVQFAFESANSRNRQLHLFIKGDQWQMLTPLWLKVIESVQKKYPKVKFDWDHADTGFAGILHHPHKYDVVIALGIAGDIISDPLATLLYGSHCVVPSANINPSGLAVFQTVHGTAFAIAGQNKANPVGMIRAVAMMLRLFFKMTSPADSLESAVRKVLAKGYRTVDLYRENTSHRLLGTTEFGRLVEKNISTGKVTVLKKSRR